MRACRLGRCVEGPAGSLPLRSPCWTRSADPTGLQACRGLKEISHSRETWAAILSRYITTGRIPQPFCLPKPLPSCSSRELEKSIVAWEASWPAVVSTTFTEATIDDFCTNGKRLPIGDGMRMRILPGGRWVLAQLTDGSISYLDLQGLSKSQSPRLYLKSLIPATHRHQEFLTEWCDFAIDAMLSATLENHHLVVFNLAVGVSHRPREGAHGSDVTNRINVYCVQVVGSCLHVEHLSVFEDPLVDTSNGWGRLRLVGSHVAYVRRREVDDEVSTQYVAVVEWQGLENEGSPTDAGIEPSLKRWLIPTPNHEISVSVAYSLRMSVFCRAMADIVLSTQELLLLPEDRIFVCCDYGEPPNVHYRVIRLYDWNHGVQDRHHHLDAQALNEIEVEPLWASRELSTAEFQWEAPLRFPYFMPNGEVRLGTRCPAGLSGVRVPRSAGLTQIGRAGPEAVVVDCLRKDETKQGDRSENTHYNRTISLQRHLAFYHPWNGVDEGRELPTSHLDFDPSILNNSFDFEKPMYDPFSRRVVYQSDRMDSTICVLDLLVPK